MMGGHGHGPNTNMANGLGNPTASLIEGCSPDVQREEPRARDKKQQVGGLSGGRDKV